MPEHQPTIAIDARMYGDAQTGIGKYTARLLELVPPRMPGVRFVAFLRPEEYRSFRSPHPNVETRAAGAHWYGYREQLEFPLQLLAARADLVHFPHFNVPLAYPGRFSLTIHDLTPHTFPGPKMGSWWHRAAFGTVFRSAIARAQAVIAVSRYTAGDLARFAPQSTKKTRVIGEGVDPAFTTDTPREASREVLRARYGISRPFILYVGVWREHKNLTGLVEAFARMRKAGGPDVDLVLTGREQASYPGPREAWERLGIGERVVRPGFVPAEDLPHFYRAALLTAIPSFAEGFGFTGLESLACGTPVMASNVTSLPEVLSDGAFYCNPHDTAAMAAVLRMALENTTLRAYTLSRAPQVLARWRWDAMADATAALWHELLAHP